MALTEKECIELGVNPQHCGIDFDVYHAGTNERPGVSQRV